MGAAPTAPFEMPEPDFLFEFLIIALDAPAQFGEIDQPAETDVSGRVESQYLARLFLPSGHSINSHSSGRLSAV